MSANLNPATGTKLLYLDGIRGLSAVYVAMCHAKLFCGHNVSTPELTKFLRPFSLMVSFQNVPVCIFIVLSGYCLAIPVAKNAAVELRGGIKDYLYRRAKRILPPYYASLLLFIALILTVPILQTPADTAWDTKIPMTYQNILSHVFMVHNLSLQHAFKINGPMWTVATEWQIYFVFPLLVLIWRKVNVFAATLTGLAIGAIIGVTTPAGYAMHSWFLGLFSLGMLASVITFSTDEKIVRLRNGINWKLTSILVTGLAVAIVFLNKYKPMSILGVETMVGVAVSCFLIYFSLIEINNLQKPRILRFFNHPKILFLGLFSYSIYLIHSPILGLLNLLTIDWPISVNTRWIAIELIGVPISIFVSYLFFLLVEKRFLTGHNQQLKSNIKVAHVA